MAIALPLSCSHANNNISATMQQLSVRGKGKMRESARKRAVCLELRLTLRLHPIEQLKMSLALQAPPGHAAQPAALIAAELAGLTLTLAPPDADLKVSLPYTAPLNRMLTHAACMQDASLAAGEQTAQGMGAILKLGACTWACAACSAAHAQPAPAARSCCQGWRVVPVGACRECPRMHMCMHVWLLPRILPMTFQCVLLGVAG